jgi:plastocyanin
MRPGLSTASAVLIALAATSGCGSSGPSGPSSSGTATITIAGQNGTQAFSPNPASFAGRQVVFRNTDAVTHRVVLNDGSVDTGDIAPGATSRTVTMPGTGTNYHCTIHPGMIGSVGGESAPPPPCVGDYCSGY